MENPNQLKKKSALEPVILLLAVLSFAGIMAVIFFDAAKFIDVSLWVLYTFLGLINLVVYGLLLVLRSADGRLGLRFNFFTMIVVVLGSASLTFIGLERLGYVSGLSPIIALGALLVFLLMEKYFMEPKQASQPKL